MLVDARTDDCVTEIVCSAPATMQVTQEALKANGAVPDQLTTQAGATFLHVRINVADARAPGPPGLRVARAKSGTAAHASCVWPASSLATYVRLEATCRTRPEGFGR